MIKFNTKLIQILLIALLSLMIFVSQAFAGDKTLHIAVASNFITTAKELGAEFSNQTGQQVTFSSGSSGKLYSQIIYGAPYDLFLSADTQKPTQLIKQNLALARSLQTYAIGRLVLWFRQCPNTPNLSNLRDVAIARMAIANSKLAPYGRASKQLLQSKSLWQDLQTKLIYPENISQVAQLAKLGSIDAALLAKSNAELLLNNESKATENKDIACIVDVESSYDPIAQQLVILSNSDNQRLADQFITFLKSDEAINLIKHRGYLGPNSVKIIP